MFDDVQAFLGCSTPVSWLQHAARNLDILLQDHANCEKKAAATAINLMFSYGHLPDLQQKLAQLAREELLHYEQVLGHLRARQQTFVALSASGYVAHLRRLVRTHEPARLVDMLVLGALIEARSCERFEALIPWVDEELGRYYRYLLRSESRHFADYLHLAYQYGAEDDVSERIRVFVEAESSYISSPDPLFRFHSGVPLVEPEEFV